jgi:hypothetical protein
MEINGLPVPKLLQQLIEQGRWKRPADTTILEELTGSRQAKEFDFLDVDGMRRETSSEDLIGNSDMARIYGLASSERSEAPIADPAVLDVDKSILIAVNWNEEAIGLDYRTSNANPRVVVSYWPSNTRPAKWKVIAPDFTSFVLQLGL